MAKDFQHQSLIFKPSEIDHHYGKNIHILSSPLMISLLAKLGSPSTKQPEINQLIEILYNHLIDYSINSLFPKKLSRVDTRMKNFHPEGCYEGESIDSEIPCVTVDLARAGTYPSHLCYEKLNILMNPDKVRQDHFYVARQVDEHGKVIGVNVSGSKIGGGIQDAIVMFPDPMGATGGTMVEVVEHYKSKVGGRPLLLLALHLIVTPEYIKNVTTRCPDLQVFALRLDRGLSSSNVLNEVPGKFWNQEIGLNDHQYIIPGAGGLGEILNNSYC
jgi:uracil phosphoribosyltransferase